MKKVQLLLSGFVLGLVLLTGCKKEMMHGQQDNANAASISNDAQANVLDAQLKAKLTNIIKTLPAGAEKRISQRLPLLSKLDPQYRNMVRQATNAAPVCNDNTPLNNWLNLQLADWDFDVIYLASITGMLDFPTYDALLFANSSDGQFYGVNGEYSKIVVKTFKDIKRFWNIESGDMVIGAMHGSMLLDRERVKLLDMILYGDSPEDADFWADLIVSLVNEVPQYRKGNHPIFTFNAFSQSSFFFPPYGVIPPKVIMGDGIMDGYTAIGYGDVAPQAIFAHEYGHQVQIQLNLFDAIDSPEGTRRTELMADAYSSYYLSHARGASMQWKRVKQFLQVFYNIGDCAFTSTGHHGTPGQRMAASEWAYSVANNAQKQGHILTAEQFTALFEAQLPTILTK